VTAPRILYHHRTAAEDGQAVHIRAMLRAFAAVGADVREVGLVRRDTEQPEPTPSNADEKGGWSLVGSAPRFVRELMEHGYSGLARRRLLAAARDFDPHFIYERYAFGNVGGVAAARRCGRPLFLEVNSPLVDELKRTRGLSFEGLARRSERHVLENADRICAVTGVLRDLLVDLGAPRERVIVTPNGVHPDQYAAPGDAGARARARVDLGLGGLADDSDEVVLGFVGYYRTWHRLDLAIAALAAPELAHARLVLVGDGPARAELEASASAHGVTDRVHFAGPRRHAAIPAVLPAFDVALVPAINAYASPLKLHEYMAAGLPTIAPDQPNLREVLVHEREALLVAPGDADAFAAALVRLVGDGDLRRRLGDEARRQIDVQGLTWEASARRVLDEARTIGALEERRPLDTRSNAVRNSA
jgi:glycosyltransferase involved in cell wall biosynthesis